MADRFAVSVRQARRYAEQAAGAGRWQVPETSVVFTVKLPASLADRVRARAPETGVTISAVVTGALTGFPVPGSPRASAQVSDRAVETVFVFDRLAGTDLSVAYAILVPERRARSRGGPGRKTAP